MVIKITDSTRLNSSFFGGFYFLWSTRSHLPCFISPLGHATNLQSGGSVFLSSVVTCSQQLKTETPQQIVLPQSTVAVPVRYNVCLLSSVFLLLYSWQCAFGLRWKSFKTSGFSGHRHTNSIISYVWPLKVSRFVCHFVSLAQSCTWANTSCFQFSHLKKGKRGVDLKQKLLFFSWNWVRLILCWFTLRNIKPTKNNWTSQCAPFHTFHITLNNIEHCCTIIVCCTNFNLGSLIPNRALPCLTSPSSPSSAPFLTLNA